MTGTARARLPFGAARPGPCHPVTASASDRARQRSLGDSQSVTLRSQRCVGSDSDQTGNCAPQTEMSRDASRSRGRCLALAQKSACECRLRRSRALDRSRHRTMGGAGGARSWIGRGRGPGQGRRRKGPWGMGEMRARRRARNAIWQAADRSEQQTRANPREDVRLRQGARRDACRIWQESSVEGRWARENLVPSRDDGVDCSLAPKSTSCPSLTLRPLQKMPAPAPLSLRPRTPPDILARAHRPGP